MDVSGWFLDLGHGGRLFFESIPEAVSLAYVWLKEWQGLVAGVFLLVAARIFSRGTLRAARIRATGMIRAAQLTASARENPGTHRSGATTVAPVAPVSPETEMLQRLDLLRSLIRSAMSTLTGNSGPGDASPNFFGERIAALRFDENDLTARFTPQMREQFDRFLAQLEGMRGAMAGKVSKTELSQMLVHLNACARELTAMLTSTGQQLNPVASVRMSNRA